MLLCLPTLARRQRRIPGPTLCRAEQDRHALLVIHDHMPMTTGQPRLAGRHRHVVVNHQECMAILLGSAQGRAGDPTLAARERRKAEEHVAGCSDCWAMLSLLHEL